jgi:hypothetical protein
MNSAAAAAPVPIRKSRTTRTLTYRASQPLRASPATFGRLSGASVCVMVVLGSSSWVAVGVETRSMVGTFASVYNPLMF